MIEHEIILSLPVRNCTIFAQACVEDLIFLLKWLMLMFHFCVSTVSTVEHVINKTKPSFMQISVHLMNDLPVIGYPYLLKELWDRQGANIASR